MALLRLTHINVAKYSYNNISELREKLKLKVDIFMIEQLNMVIFHLVNQYAGLNPFTDTLAILAAKYMPVIVILSMAYLWIKKQNKTRDILLYGVYAAFIGLFINFIMGLFYSHPRPFMIPTGTLLFQYPAETSFPLITQP